MTATRTNLCTNPSVETTLTPYIAGSAGMSVARVADTMTGGWSIQHLVTTSGSTFVYCSTATNGPAVTPGNSYVVSADVKAVTGLRPMSVGIVWRSAAGAVIGSVLSGATITPTATGQVVRPWYTAVAPVGAATMQMFLNSPSGVAGDEYHWDAILLEAGSTPLPYFDGSSTSASAWFAWTGAANISTSTLTNYVTVVPNPAFTPPRMEITCTVPAGDVMKTATLNRIVNGVATPTLTQPGAGLDTQLVYDYFAPYGAPVSYEFVTDYVDPTAVTTVWDETWANLSAWTGSTANYTVASGKVSLNVSGVILATIARSITSGSYRAVLSSVTISGTDAQSAKSAGVVFVNSAGKAVVKVIPNLDGTVSVSSDVAALPWTTTGISGSSPITVDFLGNSVVIKGTGGSYTIGSLSKTDYQSVQVTAFLNNPGTFQVGEVKVSSYGSSSHVDSTSTAATLNSAQAWLIHPGNPALSVPISSTDQSAIAVQNLGTITQASATTLHQILGQSLPIATHSGPRYGNTQQIALKARTAAHEAALNGILADETPLLFRFPPASDIGFDEGFYSFGQVQRSRIAQRTGSHLRQFVADITRVQQPALVVQNAGWSWAALAAAFPTWAAVAQAYNTWADVLTNNRKPGY